MKLTKGTKLLMVCIICIGLITALVLLVKGINPK